mgnify:CR=1 FL=1
MIGLSKKTIKPVFHWPKYCNREVLEKLKISKRYLSNFSILNEKYKSKTIKKKHTINSDLLILKLGQNESKKIIMINEKLPERWPDNKENITLTKIKNKASVLYFNSKKTIKKETQKNKIPILWINGPFKGFLNGHSKAIWSVKTVSTPIKRKINIIDIKFINRAKYRTSLSLISQNEIAAANNGNLIQAKPLLKDTTKSDEILADMHEKSKKRIANLIQLVFNQFQENLKIEEKINDIAIKTINKSVKDLLIIIKKGNNVQIKIKILWKYDLVFKNKKNSLIVFLQNK